MGGGGAEGTESISPPQRSLIFHPHSQDPLRGLSLRERVYLMPNLRLSFLGPNGIMTGNREIRVFGCEMCIEWGERGAGHRGLRRSVGWWVVSEDSEIEIVLGLDRVFIEVGSWCRIFF